MANTQNVGVLVNTCDRFSDCWELYFHQWQKYANGLDWPLYLNTEWADYSYPEGVKGHALAVCKPREGYAGWSGSGFPTWSWCVEHALQSMPEDLVLYMQDDYFLTRQLDTEQLQKVAEMMETHPELDCVHLNEAGNRVHRPSVYSGWKRVSRWDRYFVSCQAAIWRKSTLLQLLRRHENAWQFERWGTCRARALRCHFYTAAVDGYSPVQYFCTGIVQGKWLHPVEDLFREAGIEMDFSRRGFWSERKGWLNHVRWAVQKVIMRTWPPASLWSVICCRFSVARRGKYPCS